MRFILYIILLLFFSKDLLAQYQLKGEIKDENTFLSYSTIKIYTTNNQLKYSAISNQQGKFVLDIKEKGNYIIEVIHIGFETYIDSIEVTQNITQIDYITLVQNIERIEEVVVKSKLPTIKRLSDRFIININQSPILKNKSVDEVIAMSPGVNVEHHGNISINGISGVRIMINDRLIRLSGEELLSYLKGLQASDIKNLEIISKPPAEFDAEGIGGIIKLNTLKARKNGLTGYTGSTYKQGEYPKFNSTIGVNYKWNKLLVYGTYNSTYRKEFYNRYSERKYNESSISYINNENSKSTKDNFSYRTGIDYDFHKNHFIGFEFNGNNAHSKNSQASIYTQVFDQNNLDSIVLGNYPIKGQSDSYNFNLNYIWTIDSIGKKLKFITDYSTFKRNDFTLYENDYFDANHNYSHSHNRRSIIEDAINIYTAKLDYIHPFNKKTKLELGVKFSTITSENDNLFETFSESNDQFEIDINQTNLYQYDENIYAGYLKFSSKWKKWDYNIGLRAEQTSTKNQSITLNTTINKHYLELFPSLFIKYNLNEYKKNSLMFYYGRRIGRPNYLIMNPFEYYQDEFTLKKGNPNLHPEFTNTFELTYGLYNKHFISLNYHYTENKIGDLEYRENDLTYITFDNLDTQQNLYLNIYSQFNIFKWWNSIFNLRPSYQKFESTNYKRDNFNLFLSSQNYISLNDNFNLEITSKFSSKGYDRYYKQEQNLFDLSIGIDHSLFQKRASLNYGVDNLFYTWRGNLKSSIDYAGQNNFIHSKWDTRLFYLGFKYYFKSGKKFKTTSKETSNKTEKRRQ